MKKLLTLTLLLTTVILQAQNLSLTSNTSLGDNCGQGQPTTTLTYQDVNLNGYTLTLRNVNLVVTGNLNGGGEIKNCGNPNQISSTVCVQGAIQNNPNLNKLSCTLSSPKFVLKQENYNLPYIAYNMLGQEIQKGETTESFYTKLPKEQILIIKVEGFEGFKIYLN
jgi:hypothetical protein